MLRFNSRHYFNDIFFTSLPFYIGGACFLFFFYLIVFIKKFVTITPLYLLCFLIMLLIPIITWFQDLVMESLLYGRYNRKIRAGLVFGFLCFLISEVLLFGGFFWGFFDRFFNPGYILGSFCIPSGMENIDYMRWPLVGTFVLVTSGYFANYSYYFFRAGSYAHSVIFSIGTIVLAVFFLCIQYMEYNGLSLTISDNVFGSFFFLLTGFHGFHVTVGLLFLCEQYSRLFFSFLSGRRSTAFWTYDGLYDIRTYFRNVNFNSSYNRDRHLGVAFALIYWHFVDIIWLFLFFNVYVFENTTLNYWASSNWVLEYGPVTLEWLSNLDYNLCGVNAFNWPYRCPSVFF